MTGPATAQRSVHLQPLRYWRAWLSVWLFGWLLCIALSLIAPPDLPATPPLSDKLGHFLAYGMLAAWAVQLFATRRALVLSLMALIALGIALEIAQGALTVTRMADPRDAFANTLGVLLGGVLAFTPLRNTLAALDRRLRL